MGARKRRTGRQRGEAREATGSGPAAAAAAAAQLNVEQRIEIARQQQALREAKKIVKDEINKTKEKVR